MDYFCMSYKYILIKHTEKIDFKLFIFSINYPMVMSRNVKTPCKGLSIWNKSGNMKLV